MTMREIFTDRCHGDSAFSYLEFILQKLERVRP